MSLVFQPTVNDVSSLELERIELATKVQIIRELEQCPTLMKHFSDLADAVAIEMATRQWVGDAKQLQEWALRRVAELGVYKHFYELVQKKADVLAKYADVNNQLNIQE